MITVNTCLLMGVDVIMKQSEVSSIEVAKRAGVSRSTVSRVVNNYSNVPLETREKVLKAIKELNYFPNASAQMLAGKRSRTIGLFMVSSGEISVDMLTNMMIVSVIEHASELDYYVLTNIVRDISDQNTINNIKQIFYQRRIDGGIFIGTSHREPLVDELIQEGFTVGVFDQEHTSHSTGNEIVANFNNESGMKQVIAYLVGLGHSRIGIINGDLKRLSGLKKYEGFIKAMKLQQLPIEEDWVLVADFTEEAGYKSMIKFLDGQKPLPTAFIAANDSIAFGAMRALRERQIDVPGQVSMIGFDDHVLSEKHIPALTTVKVDFKLLFQQLLTQLINKIEHPSEDLREISVDCSLIVRQSCARV